MNADLTAPVEAAARAAHAEGRKEAAALLPPKTADTACGLDPLGEGFIEERGFITCPDCEGT